MDQLQLEKFSKLLEEYLEVLKVDMEDLRQKYMESLKEGRYKDLEKPEFTFVTGMAAAVVAGAIQASPELMLALSMAPDAASAFGVISKYAIEVGVLFGLALHSGEMEDMIAKAEKFLQENQEDLKEATKDYEVALGATLSKMTRGADDGGNGGQIIH